MKIIRVFVSSPGDVQAERTIADRLIRATAEELGIPISVQYSNLLRGEETSDSSDTPGPESDEMILCPYFWEYQRFSAELGYQDQIPNTAQFDLVICILWSRLGTKLHPRFRMPDGTEPRSGTEYELAWAKAQRQKTPGKPALHVYRNRSQPNPPLDQTEKLEEFLGQWKAVKAFFESWGRDDEGRVIGAFNDYRSLEDFERLFREHFRDFFMTRLSNERRRQLIGRHARTRRWKENPFRGLQIFDFEHAPIFCGRTQAVGAVLDAVKAQAAAQRPFVLVVGASGSGKSSLIRAGVFPLITQPETIEGISLWRRAITRPGAGGGHGDCFDALAAALLESPALPALANPESPNAIRDLAEELREHVETVSIRVRDALDHAAREWRIHQAHHLEERERLLREAGRLDDADLVGQQKERLELPRARLALVVDQLEELFTSGFSGDLRQRYIAAITGLVRSGRVFVFATLRSDFYLHYQEYPDLVELANPGGKVDLRPPTAYEIGNMIQLPAEAAGLHFEQEPGTGQRLDQAMRDAAAATPESLPLLEHVLALLYEKQAARGDDLLRWTDYRELGELKGALARHAEAVFGRLRSDEQRAFPVVMRHLVTLGQGEEEVPNCRTVPYRDFIMAKADGDDSPDAKGFVDLFVKERLLVADTDPEGETTVTVTHEALLREWQRVKAWLKDNREFLRMRDRLDASLRLWLDRGKQKDDLLGPGLPLAESEKLVKDFEGSLSREQIDYVRASVTERRRRKHLQERIRYAVLAAITCLALVAGIQWFRAERQRRSAARALKAEADISAKLQEQLRQASWASFNQAERQFQLNEWREAIALLARAIKFDPANQVASQRFFHELIVHRDKALPKLVESLAHNDVVYHASFSSDGASILSASWDKSARLWERRTGRLLMAFTHGATVNTAKLSPDGALVLTASADKTAKLWEAFSGRLLFSFKHEDNVTDAAFSPDGDHVVTASADKTAKLWEAKSGKLIATFLHQGAVNAAAFSPDGRQILTASADKTARLWDAISGLQVASFSHLGVVNFAAFSPDGSRIVTTSADRTAKLWDARSANLLGTFKHGDNVYHAAFSPDGTRVISASADKSAKLWDAISGELIFSVYHQEAIFHVAFSPDGEWILTAGWDNEARLWTASGKLVASFPHQDEVNDAVFSPDGSQILTASWDRKVRLWEVIPGEVIASLDHAGSVNDVAFSPDGSRVVTASSDLKARLWDARSGKLIAAFPHEGGVNGAAFSPDGSRFVTASADHRARIWEVSSGKLVATLAHEDSVNMAVFSPDGTLIVTAGSDRKANLWNAASGKLLFSLEHDDSVNAAVFSPNGDRILTAGADKTAKLWDTKSGRQLLSFEHEDSVNKAVFSPDGVRVLTACADKTADLWDVSTGKLVRVFAHEGPVRCAVFSPDGTQVLTGSGDNTARLWDIASGKVAAVLEHQDSVLCAAFSSDSSRILTGSADNTAKLWDAVTAVELSKEVMPSPETKRNTDRTVPTVFSQALPVDILSQIATGLRFTVDGSLISVGELDRLQLTKDVQRVFGTRPAGAKFVRWFFSPGGDRTLFPASDVMAIEWIHNALVTNPDLTGQWVRVALGSLTDDGLLHVALAKFETSSERAAFLRSFGVARLPEDGPLCTCAARMLLEQHQPKLALTAVEKALLADPTNAQAQRLRADVLRLGR